MVIELKEGGFGKVTLAQSDDPPQQWSIRASYRNLSGGPAPDAVKLIFANGESYDLTTSTELYGGGGGYAVLKWEAGAATLVVVHYEVSFEDPSNLYHVAIVNEPKETITWVQLHVPVPGAYELDADLQHGPNTHAEVELKQIDDLPTLLERGENHFVVSSFFSFLKVKDLTGPDLLTITYSLSPLRQR